MSGNNNSASVIWNKSFRSPIKHFALLLVIFLVSQTIFCAGKEDYYETLGVSRDATQSEIKRAFRKLSLKHHPDKNPGVKDAQVKFAEVASAYDVLSDEKRKAQYDQFGEEGLRGDHDQEGHDPFDIFSQFFGGGRRRRSDEPSRGPDTVIPLRVSLKDTYVGKTLQVSFRRETLCTHCHGTGAAHEEDVHQCHACNGRGVVIKHRQVGAGFVQQIQTTCEKCSGKGKIWTSTCPICGGRKVVMTDLQFDVEIAPGAPEGTVYEFEGYGDELPGQEAGNLQFQLITNPDPVSRDGNDLWMDLKIALREALVGFEKTFEHLDGHKVTLKRDEVTPPRFVAVIKNEGMPIQDSTESGDLHIKIFVEFPDHLTEEQKEGLRAMFAKA
uniref:Uncharacterized protein AlNc14C18G1862 n=1 Tax=Albugo laibachii Nc14 TaxID=890382 RepID=F0W4P1_9STRA|nr:conserved hypothetical protein [Albugo laibachii Nc14]|eukprot:CCA16075.1 conserved hypothetical protein [Albugo laibachii Nc14]